MHRSRTNSCASRSIPRPAASPASSTSATRPKRSRRPLQGVGAPANLPDGKPCGNLLQAFRRQAQEVGRMERGRRLHRAPHRPAASRRSEAHRELAAAGGHSREAQVAKLQLHSGHHAVRWCSARRRSHAGRLAREAHPAEGRVPAERAQRQGDLRDSLRYGRASDDAQHAGGEGAVRGSGAALGRHLGRDPRLQPAQRLASTDTTRRTTCCACRCCARPSSPIRTPIRAITSSPTRSIRTRVHGARP